MQRTSVISKISCNSLEILIPIRKNLRAKNKIVCLFLIAAYCYLVNPRRAGRHCFSFCLLAMKIVFGKCLEPQQWESLLFLTIEVGVMGSWSGGSLVPVSHKTSHDIKTSEATTCDELETVARTLPLVIHPSWPSVRKIGATCHPTRNSFLYFIPNILIRSNSFSSVFNAFIIRNPMTLDLPSWVEVTSQIEQVFWYLCFISIHRLCRLLTTWEKILPQVPTSSTFNAPFSFLYSTWRCLKKNKEIDSIFCAAY